MRREAHEAASESCEKTGWGAPECPEKLSQVKSSRVKITIGLHLQKPGTHVHRISRRNLADLADARDKSEQRQ